MSTTTSISTPTSATGPAPATASKPTDQLAASFTDFAGSQENAYSLVNGLRTGSSITLTDSANSTSGGTSTSSSTTFSPGTKPMGYGNIRIALSLARADLANQGITNPTSEQLQGALMGTTGPNGTTQGVLQMRASGMGWGQIANAMGVKLGTVMSGKTAPVTTTGGASAVSGTSRNGIVTAQSGANGMGNSSAVTMGGGSFHAAHSQVVTGLGIGATVGSSSAVNAMGVNAGGNAGGNSAMAHGGGMGKGKP